MEDRILGNDKNEESEKQNILINSRIKLNCNELFIKQNNDCSNDSDLESEIKKCQEMLHLEKKLQDNSNLYDILIEKNDFGNPVDMELNKCKSSFVVKNFQNSNHLNNQNKTSDRYSENFTMLHVEDFKQLEFKTETDKQNEIAQNTQYSPERKKIKLTNENFHNKMEIFQTGEEFSCTANIPENKIILMSNNSINLLQNKSLNAEIQNDEDFVNSVINDSSANVNSSNNESAAKKNICENEIKYLDLKFKSIFEHIETTDLAYNEQRRDSCETNFSGDTLILHYEESDIDSEIEKCNELLNQNSFEKNIHTETNSIKISHNYNLDCNDSLEKLAGLKDDYNKFKEVNINKSNDLLFEVNNKSESNFENCTQVLFDSSDIESELKKCNELLNPLDLKNQIIAIVKDDNEDDIQTKKCDELNFCSLEVNSQIIKIDEDNQTCKNSFHIKNNKKEVDDFEILSETIKHEANSKLQNIVVTLSEKEIKKKSENGSVFVESQKNSEIRNVVTLHDESSEEILGNKKKLFTNITPQKRRPERIFKLALSKISNENISSVAKSNNNSSDQNNNSISSSELNEKITSKQVTTDQTVVQDYFEDEKDDITNPEWQAVKNLSTNEERYQQVRKCWKSRSVPDPNKNLTYHSYRKKLFQVTSPEERSIKQHKRHASSSLPGRDAKRPCTFFLDKEIDSVKRSKDIQKREIINEMQDKINSAEEDCFLREQSSQDWSYNKHRRNFYSHNHPLDRLGNISDKYSKIVGSCEQSFKSKIYTLNERRNEILKFYSFYKGLNSNDDPTFLTESQFQELDEIENIYKQFDHFYKD